MNEAFNERYINSKYVKNNTSASGKLQMDRKIKLLCPGTSCCLQVSLKKLYLRNGQLHISFNTHELLAFAMHKHTPRDMFKLATG